MSNTKRTLVALSSLIGVPILFYILGGVVGSFYPHQGSEWGVALTWIMLGILSMVVSMIAGPLVSYVTRNRFSKPALSLMGYVVPPALALIISVIATISMFANA